MGTVLMAFGAAALYLIAYHTYGRFLARKIFAIDPEAITPAVQINDNNDYVPTRKEILFGHHYTSIAGTGPIVGPAIGIIWGWLPALIWVLVGSIFMGAVHDFGAVVVSLRNQGRSIGDVAADIISPRVRIIFLGIISLLLLIVIAIFCLVIASLFNMYPQAVLSVWVQIPIAIWLGIMIYKKNKHPLGYSLIALAMLYAGILAGVKLPIEMPSIRKIDPVVTWSVILLIYAFIASTLPVWRLLQPRDYINSHKLFVAMGLLFLGVLFARPQIVAPMVDLSPQGAPPIWPFLFITIACGAISGFHSLVASGTTSKQISSEPHALTIGYGGMLLEGMLAVFVIIAVAAGFGLLANENGLIGAAAWNDHYQSWGAAKGLGPPVAAFVDGAANMLTFYRLPRDIGQAIMGVFVACFAGTTLDTATRLQRYVLSELGTSLNIKAMANKYVATTIAVVTAGFLALSDGKGQGGMLLWPLFGAANQLLAALALLVITVYLATKAKPIIYTLVPFLFMVFMTGWAMISQVKGFADKVAAGEYGSLHLLIIVGLILVLEAWMIVEAAVALANSRKHRIAASTAA